ncbi:hypothetical protein CJP46_27550 [Paenibacillus sp. XY044]|nr:hypothetical protein CJP46_27550 [Paenibacillus sp. XY044]
MHESHGPLLGSPKRLDQIFDPKHILCRDDLLWVLHYVQKKVAQKDPALLELPTPRLMRNFQYFGEAAVLLLSRSSAQGLDNERIRVCLLEAMHGLVQDSETEAAPRRNDYS